MQSRGPLMIEHRLIERMITLIKQKLNQIESTNQVDPLFIDTVVDFIKFYAKSSSSWERGGHSLQGTFKQTNVRSGHTNHE